MFQVEKSHQICEDIYSKETTISENSSSRKEKQTKQKLIHIVTFNETPYVEKAYEPQLNQIPKKSILKNAVISPENTKKISQNSTAKKKMTLKDLERKGIKSTTNQKNKLENLLEMKIQKFSQKNCQKELAFEDILSLTFGENVSNTNEP